MNQTEKLTHLKTQHQSIRIRIQWALIEITNNLLEIGNIVGTNAEELTDAELKISCAVRSFKLRAAQNHQNQPIQCILSLNVSS